MLARATYLALPTSAISDSEPAGIAAVAESAAVTRWRDDPKAANARGGNRAV